MSFSPRGAQTGSRTSRFDGVVLGSIYKGGAVDTRYALTVKFVVSADSAEEAEELVEAACEKAAAAFSEISYEGIEDIEEDDE